MESFIRTYLLIGKKSCTYIWYCLVWSQFLNSDIMVYNAHIRIKLFDLLFGIWKSKKINELIFNGLLSDARFDF